MKSELISILMSVRNTPVKLLKRAIDSVFHQTYTNWELILISDGAPTETVEYIRMISVTDIRLIAVFNDTGIGLTRSLINAAEIANGTYLARLDADDYWLPLRLESQYAVLCNNSDTVLLGTWFLEIDEEGTVVPRHPQTSHLDLLEAMFRGNPFCHSSAIIRRSAYNAVGGYHDAFTTTQDLDLWFRLSRVGQIGNIPIELTVREINRQSVSRSWKRWLQLLFTMRIHHRELRMGFTPSRMKGSMGVLLKGLFLCSFPEISAFIARTLRARSIQRR